MAEEENVDYSLSSEVIEALQADTTKLTSLAELLKAVAAVPPSILRTAEFNDAMIGVRRAVEEGKLPDVAMNGADVATMLAAASIKDLVDVKYLMGLGPPAVELKSVRYTFVRDGGETSAVRTFENVAQVVEILRAYDSLQYVIDADAHYVIDLDTGRGGPRQAVLQPIRHDRRQGCRPGRRAVPVLSQRVGGVSGARLRNGREGRRRIPATLGRSP